MTVSAVPGPELAEMSGHGCVRSGRGRGCHQLRWMTCTGCGWHSEPVGDLELLSLAHVCDPADIERRDRRIGGDGG